MSAQPRACDCEGEDFVACEGRRRGGHEAEAAPRRGRTVHMAPVRRVYRSTRVLGKPPARQRRRSSPLPTSGRDASGAEIGRPWLAGRAGGSTDGCDGVR
jgi:hypothetical protein